MPSREDPDHFLFFMSMSILDRYGMFADVLTFVASTTPVRPHGTTGRMACMRCSAPEVSIIPRSKAPWYEASDQGSREQGLARVVSSPQTRVAGTYSPCEELQYKSKHLQIRVRKKKYICTLAKETPATGPTAKTEAGGPVTGAIVKITSPPTISR